MVRLAEFRADKDGGLILAAYQHSELLADPATDATRISQTALAVQELVGSLKASGKVNWSIPAQSVFTRFVKLPPVEGSQVEQIVRFEAQQNVPYPIEEVVWDYQIVPSDEPANVEVVLVAIKEDLLEELNEAVEGAKLSTSTVDVAPMALYNAFLYNYGAQSGCTMLIDVGARTTNLIFIEGNRIFTRSITIGGNAVTAAISKDFEEPFAAAEERKKNGGFVSLGGAYAEPEDPDIAKVSKVARNTMTRLHREIARSISFYRSQQNGGAPERIYLCGGAVGMPYMKEFFEEKLALPVEFFNALKKVNVASGVDSAEVGREAHLMGELVGLALRSVGQPPMTLNLRPASVVASQAAASKIPAMAAAAVCLLAALGGWYYYNAQAVSFFQQANSDYDPQVKTLDGFDKKQKAVQAEIKARENSVAPLLTAISERQYWVSLIDDLNTRLPDRMIWISALEMNAGAKATTAAPAPRGAGRPAAGAAAANTAIKGPFLGLQGFYLHNDLGGLAVVDKFAEALAGSPFYDLTNLKKNEYNPVRPTQDDVHWTFGYVFKLPLKQPIAK